MSEERSPDAKLIADWIEAQASRLHEELMSEYDKFFDWQLGIGEYERPSEIKGLTGLLDVGEVSWQGAMIDERFVVPDEFSHLFEPPVKRYYYSTAFTPAEFEQMWETMSPERRLDYVQSLLIRGGIEADPIS